MEYISTDVLVIGSGIAGLRAAIEAKLRGVDVLLVTKTRLFSSASTMAEGGINAALCNVDRDDSWEKHFEDTVRGGAYLNDQDLVEVLVKEVIDRVYELEEWGAVFSRLDNGLIAQRAFGKQSRRRTCYASDRTGHEIVTTLLEVALDLGVEMLEYHYASKILVSSDRVAGAIIWNVRGWEPIVVKAKAVVLATGGASQMYEITTTPAEATGDGMVLALDAGAVLKDMEMVQFHPTGLAWPEAARGQLVTEAVRAEGGILLNALGERFMSRYAPDEMELAGRDVVARAIWREVVEGRGTEHGGVYLDITHIPCERVRERLESTYRFLLQLGVDMCRDRIEVTPTAHYFMGGVRIDVNASTDVKGLYAAGEVASGVHGANRLGGNSLADALVFGRRAGASAASYARSVGYAPIDANTVKLEIERVENLFRWREGYSISYTEIRKRLREIMWRYVALVRREEGLLKALSEIEYVKRELLPRLAVNDGKHFSLATLRTLECINMVRVTEIVVRSALIRTESRGAHYREDYPYTQSEWLKHIVFRLDRGALVHFFEPVKITRINPLR